MSPPSEAGRRHLHSRVQRLCAERLPRSGNRCRKAATFARAAAGCTRRGAPAEGRPRTHERNGMRNGTEGRRAAYIICAPMGGACRRGNLGAATRCGAQVFVKFGFCEFLPWQDFAKSLAEFDESPGGGAAGAPISRLPEGQGFLS